MNLLSRPFSEEFVRMSQVGVNEGPNQAFDAANVAEA
jgi:hypothetical protein